jgi:hypothetical protein
VDNSHSAQLPVNHQIPPTQKPEALELLKFSRSHNGLGHMRWFFNLLRLFFAAVAVLDCIMWMLRAHKLLFAALRLGIKDTWHNLFSRFDEVFSELPCAFAALV